MASRAAPGALSADRPPRVGRRGNWRIPVMTGLLVAAIFATFWPVSRNDFINYDDNVIIYLNPHVLQGLTASSLRWAVTSLDGWNWIPVTRIAHMLNAHLFGVRPGPHHLTSVFYHAAAAALLFLALRRMAGRLWAALAVSALFALHPLRVESVAWAAELKDPLSGSLFSLTLLAYAAYVARPAAVRYLLLLGSFALGLMAKPTLVPLPVVLLLLDYWPLGRLDRRAVAEKTPLLLLSGAAGMVTYLAQSGGHAMSSLAVIPLRARFGNALSAVAFYLRDFFWPRNLAVIYPHRGENFPGWPALAGAALLLLFTWFALRHRHRRPWLAVGWFWYLGFLVPVLGLIQVGVQSRADRYTYLPLIGIAVALCWGIPEPGTRPRWRSLTAIAAAVALLALAVVSRRTCGFWQDDETLFGHALDVTRDNGPALAHLGADRSSDGRLDEAAVLLRRSIAILPGYAFAHNALGNVLSLEGRDDEAIQSFRNALRLEPGWADAHNNLGAALAALGRFDEAALHFTAALAARSDMPEAADNLRKIAPLLRH